MALLWIDSFDTYVAHTANSSTVPAMPSEYTVSATVVNRDSTNSFSYARADGNYSNPSLKWAFDAAKSSGSIGIGFHFQKTGSSWDWNSLIDFLDASNNIKGSVHLNKDGTLSITGYGTASTVSTIPTSTTTHVEMKLTFGSSTGSLEVRINGVSVLSVTSANTSTAIQYLQFLHRNTSNIGSDFWLTDLYIWDSTGTVNNDWMGEQNTYTFYPTADTATASWTMSSGTDGYALIDTPPGSSTNYITTDTVGNEVTFDFTDVPDTNIAITGVSTFVSAEKTGTEGTTIAVGLNQNYGSDINLVQNTYNSNASIQEQNPTTSANWAISDINAAVLSIKRTA